jgi:hypothetical protein
MKKLIDILARSDDGRLEDNMARMELAVWILQSDQSDLDEFVAVTLEAYLRYRGERERA